MKVFLPASQRPYYNHNHKQQRIDKFYVNRGDYLVWGGVRTRKKNYDRIDPKAAIKKRNPREKTVPHPPIEDFSPDSSPELGPAADIPPAIEGFSPIPSPVLAPAAGPPGPPAFIPGLPPEINDLLNQAIRKIYKQQGGSVKHPFSR